MRVQVSLPESVTDVRWLVAPVYRLAETTKRLPAVVGVPKLAVSDVPVVVAVPPAVCTSLGVVPPLADTVTVTVVLWLVVAAVPVTVIG